MNSDYSNNIKLTHGSLFSGIGGFDLAAEWMGWKNVFHCENNPFGKKVLQYYWPNAISYDDITKTDFTIHRGTIDILTGGFPCQPYSTAGKRKGKEDERHLWPEMLRAIREIQPNWVVGENVRGLTNWNGGLVFDEVQADLETEGYKVQAFLLPAAGVNAPHERYRIWFVAYSNKRTAGSSRTNAGTTTEGSGNNDEPKERGKQTEQHFGHGNVYGIDSDTGLQRQAERQKQTMGINELCQEWNATNARCSGRKDWLHGKEPEREATKFGNGYTKFGAWVKFPIAEPTICGGNDGLSSQLDGITIHKHRNESIKAYGNAIVPQVALQIFKAIQEFEQNQIAS